VKSKIVDTFQIHDRWIEEVALAKTEMANFSQYYSDISILTLQRDIAIMDVDMSGLHHPFELNYHKVLCNHKYGIQMKG